jgi:hypothetical protein
MPFFLLKGIYIEKNERTIFIDDNPIMQIFIESARTTRQFDR